MRVTRIGIRGYLVAATLMTLVPLAEARAQSAPHLVAVKLVGKPGGAFAFEPATFKVERGDTVRFIQESNAPHNEHFKTMPKGANLRTETSGPYLMAPESTYDIVIDSRFIDGTYGIVCDPHESVGMRATMTVGPSAK